MILCIGNTKLAKQNYYAAFTAGLAEPAQALPPVFLYLIQEKCAAIIYFILLTCITFPETKS
jgi:hypothetical protein